MASTSGTYNHHIVPRPFDFINLKRQRSCAETLASFIVDGQDLSLVMDRLSFSLIIFVKILYTCL